MEEIINEINEEEVFEPVVVDEPIKYNKIYARANENGVVTHIFSEAFEDPKEIDICINETNIERHGAQKYRIVDEDGYYNYKLVDGQLVERDKTEDIEKTKKQELRTKRAPLLEAFDVWEKAVLRGREEDSEEVMIWYRNILDLNEEAINNIPFVVEYYIDNAKK